MENLQTKISLFKSLFNGREDVFAIRWEKDKKSGYETRQKPSKSATLKAL